MGIYLGIRMRMPMRQKPYQNMPVVLGISWQGYGEAYSNKALACG
jgi:hypothetical protein